MVAPLAKGAAFFSTVSASGSHLDSIICLASKEADIATIDCIVHAFVMRHQPHLLTGTRSLGYSPLAPTPPYIIPTASVEDAPRIRAALDAAANDADLVAARDELFFAGFSDPESARPDVIHMIEERSVKLGYPQLR
jgi:ABC-type phosphate/phosphonate transport system substrate-binding protein